MASRWPPQTGTANGLVSEGGVFHERTAPDGDHERSILARPALVRACGKGRPTEYCRPPAGLELSFQH